MQADRVQVLAQQAAAGNVDAFIALVQEFAPDLRVMLAAHLDQPIALPVVESAVWSAVRQRLGEFIGDPQFATWIQSVAIEPVTAHLTQADRRAVDIQDALAHQNIQACHEALADGRELQVVQLRHRIAALPETARVLLTRRYRDRQRPSDIAANLMISESELAVSLATARALCDWRELARPPAVGDRLLPPLIEDWLNQTIDVDSRALLATNLGRDPERAVQFARQVRVHLALGACLAPFTREDAASLVRQAGLGAGDSGRVMMGEGTRPSAAVRSAGSDARRPARIATGNRQAIPLTDDAPRPSPMPWIIGGGMVLVGIFALVAMSMRTGTTKVAPARPMESEPTVATPASTATPTSITPTTPERTAPVSGGVLRLDPGRTTGAPPPPPRVALSSTGRAYAGQPLVLRADLSHSLGVTAVEFWKGEERVATVSTEPFAWTWDQPPVGTTNFSVRALGAAGTLATSSPTPVSIEPAYGSGTIRREWWTGVSGFTIAEGTSASGYPDRPQGEANESSFASPRDWGNDYLERMRGFIVPPQDGEYVFWIAGDDESELWLSADDKREGLRCIAVSPMIPNFGIKPEEWEHSQSQRSSGISLKRGQRYYVEVLHKEGTGEDHVAVGWRLPDGTLERPIPGAHLAPPTEPVPAGASVTTRPPVANIVPAPSMLVLWNGDNAAGGSGYASSGITKVAGSGREGSTGLQAPLTQGFCNIGWNWFSWSPDDAGSDLRAHKAISFWMRIDGTNRPSSASLQFLSSPKSTQPRSASIDLAALVPQFSDGQWHEVVIPLERLTAPGFDLAKVWEFNLKLQGKGVLAATLSIDDLVALPVLAAPTPTPAPTLAPAPTSLAPAWKMVRAINLGGETTEIDGVRFIGHRQAEAESATPAGSHQPGPWLDEMAWVRANNANGEIRRNRSWSDKPLSIDGKVYAHGLGTHAASEMIFTLDGRYSGFTAIAGIDDAADPGEAIFQVWVDGQKAWDSGALRKGAAKPVAVPLAGRKELRLVVDPNGGNDWDHADWGNAQLLIPGGNDGTLQVQAGRRTTATFTPKPAVDAKVRALLSTALGATKEGLAFKVKVPNGISRVWLWVAESGAANSRQCDLTVEGQTLANVGQLPANGWEKIGPIEVSVADGTIDVAATVLKGLPQVMGILVEQSSAPDVITDTLESTPVGQKTLRAVTFEDTNVPSATIRVTEDTAASGKRSLKFTDAPGQKNNWDPLLCYEPRLNTGMVECRFAMRIEAGVQVVHEWRGPGGDHTRPGPSLRIDGEGRLKVNDKELVRVPLGQWFTVAVTTGLGPQATGTWTLAVTLPGAKEAQRFSDLTCHGDFRSLYWLGFFSDATQDTVFYLDDVEVGPAR